MKCVEAVKRDNCSVFVIIAKRVFAELHKKNDEEAKGYVQNMNSITCDFITTTGKYLIMKSDQDIQKHALMHSPARTIMCPQLL